jgi:hypothetical protein
MDVQVSGVGMRFVDVRIGEIGVYKDIVGEEE